MINWLIKKVVGSKNARMIKGLRPVIDRINALEEEYRQLSDDQLRAKTFAWKERLAPLEDPERPGARARGHPAGGLCAR
jgi:preprotein translocase subunit SecA